MRPIPYRLAMVPISVETLSTWQGRWLPHRLELTGTCPTCTHDTPGMVPLRSTSLEALVDTPPPSLTAAFLCQCGADHPGRAPTDRGCGGSWAAVATAHDDRSVTLSPAGDPVLVEAAHALRADRASQLDRLRSAAEKWIPALGALLGLIAIAGATVGTDQIGQLTAAGRVAVASAITVGVIAAAVGILGAYRAAHGWPRNSTVDTPEKLLDWYERRQDLPERTARWLRSAVYATAVSLSALTVAGGLSWFLPGPGAAAPIVRVLLRDDSVACGTLLSSPADGMLRVRQTYSGAVMSMPTDDVRTLTIVDSC
jgi:hypothetical protein